jgi:hypothetical protein
MQHIFPFFFKLASANLSPGSNGSNRYRENPGHIHLQIPRVFFLQTSHILSRNLSLFDCGWPKAIVHFLTGEEIRACATSPAMLEKARENAKKSSFTRNSICSSRLLLSYDSKLDILALVMFKLCSHPRGCEGLKSVRSFERGHFFCAGAERRTFYGVLSFRPATYFLYSFSRT